MIEISLNNPAPRVDEKIEVTLRIPGNEDEPPFGEPSYIAEGEIRFMQVVQDTGMLTLGPFSLVVNKKEYTSYPVEVKIYPSLPPVRSGLWVRQVSFLYKDYLIVEQRIPGEWKAGVTQGSMRTAPVFDTSHIIFAKIDPESIDPDQLTLELTHSTTYSQESGEKQVLHGYVDTHYKRTVYEIKKGPDFKGSYELRRRNFINLPHNTDFRSWTIQ